MKKRHITCIKAKANIRIFSLPWIKKLYFLQKNTDNINYGTCFLDY